MIKFKTGKCVDCDPNLPEQPLYSMGRCCTHYWIFRAAENESKKNAKNRVVNPNSEDVNTQTLAKIKKDELQNWFSYHIEHSAPICENCGEPLYYPDKTIAISCQAHILPKKPTLFPSVAGNLNNHLVLGGLYQNCSCHGQFDSSWRNAERMPVFKIAIERFLIFKPFIAESELKSLPYPFINLYYN